MEQIINHNEIITIESNTSATDNSNGRQVQRRSRHAHQIRGYGIPLYQGNRDQPELNLSELTYELLSEPQLYLTSPVMSSLIVKHVQQRLHAFNYSVGTNGPDGFTESAPKPPPSFSRKPKNWRLKAGWGSRPGWPYSIINDTTTTEHRMNTSHRGKPYQAWARCLCSFFLIASIPWSLSTQAAAQTLRSGCESLGGVFNPTTNECSGQEAGSQPTKAKDYCKSHAGTFNACASPCRRSPGLSCIAVCEWVCTF